MNKTEIIDAQDFALINETAKREAVARSNAILQNAGLPTYAELVHALQKFEPHYLGDRKKIEMMLARINETPQ